MKKRDLRHRKKRQAESDEQKQIHNDKKRLATQKKWEAESDEQNKLTMKKKTCDEEKTGSRV